MRKETPQLDFGKRPDKPLHVDMLIPYPSDTPFANLVLTEFELFGRVDHLNILLRDLYRTWRTFVPGLNGFVPPEVPRMRYQTEDIVYSLRKVVDTLIQISWVLGNWCANRAYQDRIAVDGVGPLLTAIANKRPGESPWVDCYRPHHRFLALLNDISNTYKHHLANSETCRVVAAAEPSAFYISAPQNRAEPRPRLRGVSLSHLFKQANELVADVRQQHRTLLAASNPRQGE